MTIHRSMKVADAVVAAIVVLHDHDNDDLTLETFQNCRENGYHIIGKAGKASFAENRNSDDVVVYYGPNDGFDLNNFPKDWSRKKFFRHGQFTEAASFILQIICDNDTGN